ncbi:MAG: DUF4340 domain-containing protein [Thermodesulfobacteriota bacterium]
MLKKEYLILLAVIIGACLYLYLKDRDRVNYQLPDVKPVEQAAITAIDIRRPGREVVTLEKVDGRWCLAAGGYPADEAQVKGMLEALSGLALTALVSESKDYDRYDLSEAKALLVTARSGDKTAVRELAVGKRASSYNHTFVRIGQDPNVYHAGGSIHDTFDKDAQALRDKTVLAFDRQEIQRIAIDMAGEKLELEKQPVAAPAPVAEEGEVAPAATPPAEQKPVWKTADGQSPPDPARIDKLLGELSALKGSGYLPEGSENDLKNPAYTITLAGKKTYTLSLFAGADKEKNGYAGLSSENKSVFTLSDFQAELIMKKPSELMAAPAAPAAPPAIPPDALPGAPPAVEK